MDRLIPMTDFVLEQEQLCCALENRDRTFVKRIILYTNFLIQKLELWMFVPCDLYGNVLEKPTIQFSYVPDPKQDKKFIEYQEAKKRVLFEGFSFKWYDEEKTILELIINNDNFYWYFILKDGFEKNHKNIEIPKTIEDIVWCNLVLTESAKQKIFNT